MIPRNSSANWQAFAQPEGGAKLGFAKPRPTKPNAVVAAVCGDDHDTEYVRYPSLDCRPACPPGGPDFPQGRMPMREKPLSEGEGQIFPFPSCAGEVDSWSIKTRARGLAECVSPPSFWRQPPLWPSRAASATTPIHPPIAPRSARLAAPQPVPLLPMQPVAAKPKARLSAPWLAVCLAAFRAFRPATDSTTDLARLQTRGGHPSSRSHPGFAPRVAFLHFAPVALLKRGIHV